MMYAERYTFKNNFCSLLFKYALDLKKNKSNLNASLFEDPYISRFTFF